MKSDLEAYNEVRFDGKRRFELADGRVLISANLIMGPSYETQVGYDLMDPAVSVVREHYKLFWPAVVGIPLFAIITFVMVDSLGFQMFDFLPGLFLGLTIISFVVATITRRPIEYARFCTSAGIPILDIGRAGPDRDKFDQYIASIMERIESVSNEK